MLFDPKWKKTKKRELLNTRNLISWLEKQNPSQEYSYTEPNGCLLAQYFAAHGYPNAEVGPHDVWLTGNSDDGATEFPLGWNTIASDDDRTFGAALKRAKAWIR